MQLVAGARTFHAPGLHEEFDAEVEEEELREGGGEGGREGRRMS